MTRTEKSERCYGRASTCGEIPPVLRISQHNHLPDPDRIAALLAVDRMVEVGKTTDTNPRKIIKEVEAHCAIDQFAACRMIRPKNITQRIQRARQLGDAAGPNATTREEIEISDRQLVTINGEQFLLGDSGYGHDNRVISFATRKNVACLRHEKRWYGDGTFAVSPTLFRQLYTVNIIKQGKNLPMVFSLLPNKEQASYVRMFQQIAERLHVHEYPTHFSHDFERAVINAIREVFGEQVKIEGLNRIFFL